MVSKIGGRLFILGMKCLRAVLDNTAKDSSACQGGGRGDGPGTVS